MAKRKLFMKKNWAIFVLLIVGVVLLYGYLQQPPPSTFFPLNNKEIVAKLCEQMILGRTNKEQRLLECNADGVTIYVIETFVGEGGRLAYYDSSGVFIENAIREDVPIFVTKSGKKTHCITDSNKECPQYDCLELTCYPTKTTFQS